MGRIAERELLHVVTDALDVAAIYDAHAEFVWRSLHRLGVDRRDLPDLTQEVFVVVHRRRDELDPARPLRPWLFGVCVGLAKNHRRRAFRRGERLFGVPPGRRAPDDPEASLGERRRRERGRRLLAALDPEKRAVFVMFEVEGLSGAAIAEALGVPLGTVHSRLYAARRELRRALSEEES